MKNPNGYGSVIKLGGKRRKPFAARVTVGWEFDEKTKKEKQKYDYIGYYESRPDAMIALAEYNKSPYDIDARRITFAEVYDFLLKDKYPKGIVTKSEKGSARILQMAFNQSESIHNMIFMDIRKSHMQGVINNSPLKHGSVKKIKTLYTQMYDLAMSNDWVEKDYSIYVTIPANTEESTKKPFTNKKIKWLWKNIDKYNFIDVVLILIYTGMRPSELLEIENENIFLEKRYMIGGMKTEAGKDRVIPIHKKIMPLIRKRINDKKHLMLNSKGNRMQYHTLKNDRWDPLMKKIKMNHTPHECRHTFATIMDDAGANKLSIKKIMGHTSSDITDGVYTHKSIEELIKAVDLIKI